MSSTRFVKPLTLRPKPSRILGALLLVGHGGALLLLFPLALPLPAKLFLAAVLLLSWRHSWHQQAGGNDDGNIHSLHWKSDGDWLLITRAGEHFAVELKTSSYVHPWLVVLNFRLPGWRRTRSVVLFPDALDREIFRQLRVRLGVMSGGVIEDQV